MSLQVLEQDAAKRGNSPVIAVGVQGNDQNQVLVKYIGQSQKLIVGSW